MLSPLWFQKAFFRKLFRLIRKHGIALVLQGLIEFAKTDDKDPRMFVLAADLTKALHRYKEGEKKSTGPIKKGDRIDLWGGEDIKSS